MAATTAGKNKMANAIAYDFASIHTGAPGDDGAANEVTGGSYARQAITMAAAVNGMRDSSNQPKFNIPGGTTVTHYALWESGVCMDTGTLSANETFTADGEYTLSDADVGVS